MPERIQCLRNSFGPFLLTPNGYVYDVRIDEGPPVLGYNASAMFGTIHHPASWAPSGEDNDWASRDKKPGDSGFQTNVDVQKYIESEILNQFAEEFTSIAKQNERSSRKLAERFPTTAKRIDAKELVVEIEFCATEAMTRFEIALERQSILANSAPPSRSNESRTTRFRFNLGWREPHLSEFWNRLERCLDAVNGADLERRDLRFSPPTSVEQNYQFHSEFLLAKIHRPTDQMLDRPQLTAWFDRQVDDTSLSLAILDRDSYAHYRSQILGLQAEVYEPARQSPPEEFDGLFTAANPLGLLVLQRDQIVAMSFSGPLGLFRNERGVETDPFLNQPDSLNLPGTYYSMDLTVVPEFRGGLGRIVKQAICLLAVQTGVSAIHGRNRDHLARGMWAINLSLGAYEIQHLVDDYSDDFPNRDCIYYRCPLHWNSPDSLSLTPSDIQQKMPLLINRFG